MSKVKAGGSTKNLSDSNPKYLGVKRYAGEAVKTGVVIVRQRGTKILPGAGVGVGRDHTLFALRDGIISFRNMRQTRFDGKAILKKVVDVVASA